MTSLLQERTGEKQPIRGGDEQNNNNNNNNIEEITYLNVLNVVFKLTRILKRTV